MSAKTIKIYIILCAVIAVIITTFSLVPHIPQKINHYIFADTRTIWGIPNTINVLSNIPFIILGFAGLSLTLYRSHSNLIAKIYAAYPFATTFIGSILLGIGSTYYHLDPNQYTLFLDRLPMTVIFMAIMCMILEDRISIRTGHIILFLSVLIGVSSVVQWQYTELSAKSDLRYYLVIQFLPIMVSIMTLLLFPKGYDEDRYWYWIFTWFFIAKICETFDYEIYKSTSKIVSGHTLKNLAGAMSIYLLIKYLEHKRTNAL